MVLIIISLNDFMMTTFNQAPDPDCNRHAISYLKPLSKSNACVFNISPVAGKDIHKIFNNLRSKTINFNSIGICLY